MGMFDDYVDSPKGGQPSSNNRRRSDDFDPPKKSGSSRDDSRGGSGAPKKKKSGKARVAVLVLAIIFLNAVGSVVAFGESLFNTVSVDTGKGHLEEYVSTADSASDLPPYQVSHADIDIVLVIGCDSRVGNGKPSRSDTMMLAAIDRKHKKLKVVSLMRDIMVQMPNGRYDRINTAFYLDTARGNTDLRVTRSVIERNLGIKVDNYVAIDFTIFEKLVDELGGIELNFENVAMLVYMFHNSSAYQEGSHYGYFPRFNDLTPGMHLVNGAEAVCYARARYVYTGDNKMDFDRTRRQRHVVDQILAKVKTQSPAKLIQITTKLAPYITTNFSQDQLFGYITQLKEYSGYDMKTMRIPIEKAYHQDQIYNEAGAVMAILAMNRKFNSEQLGKFLFEDDMTYEGDDYKPAKVTLATLPADQAVRTGNKTEETSSDEDETTTSKAKSTTAPTTSSPPTESKPEPTAAETTEEP